jgi:hypothetical protein
VKSTNGDTFLGGEDFDMRIVNYLADEFKKEHGVDLTKDKMALQRLKEAAEKAKIELSSSARPRSTSRSSRWARRPAAAHGHEADPRQAGKPVGDLIKRSIKPCKAALKDAGLSTGDIDEVVLVGGMTRMPEGDRRGDQVLRQGAAQGREPRRGRRHGRRHSGRRAAGRRQGRGAARRDAAVAGHRDAGRRVHPPDRPQHDDPDQEVARSSRPPRTTRTR